MNEYKKTEEVYTLFECAEKFGLVFALTPFGKNIKVKIPMGKSFCEQEVEKLDLSVRSYNALKRMNISKISELFDFIAHNDLKEVRNIGRKCVAEIKTKLLVRAYERLSDKDKLFFWMDFTANNKLPTDSEVGGGN